tara:strand:- start:811 stop:1497 length:687 start_codon:yes stop_codon:yes gene_type:complete
MLKLSQSLSLNAIKKSWSPDTEARLEAWYKNKTGITLNGSDVSAWADSSSNSNNMVQSDASYQPAYTALTGALTFESSVKHSLQTTGQISLTGAFTVGIIFNPSISAPGTILGDNAGGSAGHEFFKYTSTTNLRVKIHNTTGNLPLDSGTFGDDYIVVTRDAGDRLNLWKNGVLQSASPVVSGTAEIDAIGVRESDQDYLDGVIKEIQIYTKESSGLTYNVNSYLSSI